MTSRSLIAGVVAVLAASTVTAAALLDPQATAPVAPVAAAAPQAPAPPPAPPAPAATPAPAPAPAPSPAPAPAPHEQVHAAAAARAAVQALDELDLDLDLDMAIDLDDVFDDIGQAVERAVDAKAIAQAVEEATRNVDVDAIVAKAMQSVEGVLGGTPRLGIGVRDVTADEAKQAGLDGIRGAWVMNVASESAAAKAGLAEGDIVVRLDGQDVRSARHLTRLVGETPAGRTVSVEYLRGGSRGQASVTLEAARRLDMTWRGREPREFSFRMREPLLMGRGRARLGIGVQDLTPQLAQYFGVKEGVLVTQVNEGTPAARGGMKAGDVITKVHDTAVTSIGDISRALAQVEGGATVTVEVSRDKAATSLSVTLDKTRTRGPVTIRPRGRSSAE